MAHENAGFDSGRDHGDEPPALNRLLLARLSEQDRQQALRDLVGALWQEAMPLASHIVIKTSSWNIFLKTAQLKGHSAQSLSCS